MDDAMAELRAYLPAADATRVYRKIDQAAHAAATPADGRTMDQRRADTLTDLILNPAATTNTTTGATSGTGGGGGEGKNGGTSSTAGGGTSSTGGGGCGGRCWRRSGRCSSGFGTRAGSTMRCCAGCSSSWTWRRR